MALDAAQIRLCPPPAACEDCLRRGAEQLGLVDPDEQTAMLETQREALQRMAEENAGLRAHNDALAKAVQSKPASSSRGARRE
jgi:hypothetical protein